MVWLTALFLLTPASGLLADELPIIDAHSQMDKDVDPRTIIDRMDEAGVARTILSARHGRTPGDVLRVSAEFPERIIPSVTTKMWGYVHDSKKPHKRYRKALRAQVDSGRFRAMAEVLMVHSGCPNDMCPPVRVEPGDKRVTAALAAALANGWPFVAHIEFRSLSSSGRRTFMDGLKGMLRAHPRHPFALIHMGQLGPDEARRLIEAFGNIYFLAAHSNPVSKRRGKGFKEWIEMFEGGRLKPEWRRLMVDHPGRFVFALDNVWGAQWNDRHYYADQVALWRNALAELPAEVAHAVAHKNAERLWRLPPAKHMEKASP